MMWLRRIAVVGFPALFAIAAGLAFPLWVLGIPGDPDADYGEAWFLGLLAVSAYPLAYLGLLVVLVVVLVLKLPIVPLVHGLIWLCLIAFLITMAISLTMLSALA